MRHAIDDYDLHQVRQAISRGARSVEQVHGECVGCISRDDVRLALEVLVGRGEAVRVTPDTYARLDYCRECDDDGVGIGGGPCECGRPPDGWKLARAEAANWDSPMFEFEGRLYVTHTGEELVNGGHEA